MQKFMVRSVTLVDSVNLACVHYGLFSAKHYLDGILKAMKLLARIVNYLLGLVGLKLIPKSADAFRMTKALERLFLHIPNVRTVIDIGASNGVWSEAAMRAFPKSSFLAVEPLIEREHSLRAIQSRIPRFDYALCVAGSPNDEIVRIHVAEDLDGSAVDIDGISGRQVPSKTIDQLVVEKGLAGPFILKFDTHGFEQEILEGARKTLHSTEAIIMECYNFNITKNSLRFPDMCQALEKLGFRPMDLADPMLRPTDSVLWQFDLIFMKSDATVFLDDLYESH